MVDPLQVLRLNLLCLDFALTPELVAIIRRMDRRPFPCFAFYAVEGSTVAVQVGVFRLPVVSTAGAPDSAAVAVDAPIELTFSRAMDPNSLTLDATPPLIGWQASWNPARTIATITHDGLRGGAVYTVTALAFDDNSISLAQPYRWSFRAAARIYLPTVVR